MTCRKAFWRCDEVISTMWHSRRLSDRSFRRSVHYRGPHEENLPAQEAIPPSRSRLPSPDEQQGRRSRHSEPPPQGSPPADQVAGRPLEEAVPAAPQIGFRRRDAGQALLQRSRSARACGPQRRPSDKNRCHRQPAAEGGCRPQPGAAPCARSGAGFPARKRFRRPAPGNTI